MLSSRTILPTAVAALLIALPATAHHSGRTYFDLDREIEHTDATVVSYVLVNPHGRLTYSITDDGGNVVEWVAELASANNLRRRGLGGEVFKPGDKLTSVMGNPGLGGTNFMRISRAEFENGDVAQLTGRNTGVTRAGN